MSFKERSSQALAQLIEAGQYDVLAIAAKESGFSPDALAGLKYLQNWSKTRNVSGQETVARAAEISAREAVNRPSPTPGVDPTKERNRGIDL